MSVHAQAATKAASSARDAGKANHKPVAMNTPGDAFEREAHMMSEDILYLPAGYSYAPALSAYGGNDGGKQAPAIVHEVLNEAGSPLDATIRAFMEPRFGHSFGKVRVHYDAKAARSAKMINAKAFTAGHDIVFGQDQYAPASEKGLQLIAHELAHTIHQERLPAHSVLQRDLVDDAREKLSYDWNDWLISDSDATEALDLLGQIDPAQLKAELGRLGQKYVTRLLDNLPDAAKAGPVYTRVIEALGTTGVLPYATELLSYSWYSDWLISDSEVSQVFNLYETLPASSHEQFFTDLLAAKRLGRLIDNSNEDHHKRYIQPWLKTLQKGKTTQAQKDILHVIADESDNLATTVLAAEIRFDVTVGPSKDPNYPGVTWNVGKLRETYLVLENLPEAHVARNKALEHLGQYNVPSNVELKDGMQITSTVAGAYGDKALNINTEDVSDFEGTVIHETGHAVDKQLGWTDSGEPAKPERGGWKQYKYNFRDFAKDWFVDSNGGLKSLTVQQQEDVITKMVIAMARKKLDDVKDDVKALPWYVNLSKQDQRAVMRDRVFDALPIAVNEPWKNTPDGGEHFGDHIYQKSYVRWTRYRHEARSRMLTPYQFRDVGEWFAECYRFYYAPDPRGKGAKLNEKDPNTKVYFDTHVDTLPPSR